MAVTKVGNLEWQFVGVGDFNGDGKADILWRNTRYGKNQIWRSASSSTISALATVGSQSWKVVGIGDFNGDGSTAILWRATAAGRNALWLSGNAKIGRASCRERVFRYVLIQVVAVSLKQKN